MNVNFGDVNEVAEAEWLSSVAGHLDSDHSGGTSGPG